MNATDYLNRSSLYRKLVYGPYREFVSVYAAKMSNEGLGRHCTWRSLSLFRDLMDWRGNLARCSRIHISMSSISGFDNCWRIAFLSSAVRPLIWRSISNSASIRFTMFKATGEMTAAFLPCAFRRALASKSACAKNGRLACAQLASGKPRNGG